MTDINPSHNAEDYDFVLVGAGSAACLLASRLSEQLPSHKILILEAGQHVHDDPRVLTPGLSISLQNDAAYDWQYTSGPEQGLGGRRVKHPRGKLVGGTSAINSHSVVFPNREWQDRVASLLNDEDRQEWTAEAMENCYQRWQDAGNGPESEEERIKVSFPRKLDALQQNWVQAFEELGHATDETGFVQSAAGAVTVTNAIDASKGERSHAGIAFLDPALERKNVTLLVAAKVDRILFDEALIADGQLNASGVCYTYENSEFIAHGREIILCAGVFESPTILERSGIGPEKVLQAANVPILYALPGVGENLQDHLNCSLSCEVQDNVPTRDGALGNPEERKAALAEYEEHRTGRMSEGGAYSFAFTPLQMKETPSETQTLSTLVQTYVEAEHNPSLRAQYDIIQETIESPLEATATTFMLQSQRNRDADSMPKGTPPFVAGNFVTVVAMLAHPFSRGSSHITPFASKQPDISFNYLSHPLDTEILARHMRLIERLFQAPKFNNMRKPDGKRLPRSFPYPLASLDDAKGILPINSATNYHPCGTCSMMREELCGVVDGRLRVYGTRNLRVCDASILSVIPRGNILAAVYAFAEKAAELICREGRTAARLAQP
ncbi:hypothetical protein OPT61_g5727 [Boeremia exigua]|uniref:Uncharacterized protein n=1 Tax=Boeremia exigua TaxID=749465 RepID=A0ACC2I9B2_9PLEO|nr:hypothetical protein OPT61_g5727 [Boeremia exigua]